MDSLYAQYVKEREDFDTIEIEGAFITYRIGQDECYIGDLFISPEHRSKGHAVFLGDAVAAVAKERGCKFLSAKVDPRLKGTTNALRIFIKYGFEVHSVRDEQILLIKRF